MVNIGIRVGTYGNTKLLKKGAILIMESNVLFYEEMKREGYCRLCDRILEKNTEKVIKFRTFRGHGDPIIICLGCISKINETIKSGMYHGVCLDVDK